MFVGITRAQQELQLSLARYRDFRGQRKLTIPSSFLMELPRAEMDVESALDSHHSQIESDQAWHEADSGHGWAYEEVGEAMHAHDERGHGTQHGTQPAPRTIRLTTAAELANDGQPLSPVDTDVFRQGLWVLHATYGLGQIIALSGSAARRKATVEFQSPTCRKTLLLAEGSLRPVGA